MTAQEPSPTIAALVPMRHNSERVPGKNYRDLAGKPLYAWIIEALQAVPAITTILVDTDSPPVMGGLRANYPTVRVIERPEHLRDGLIPMNDILLYDTAQVQADYYLQTHSTNPLLRPATIAAAIDAFLNQRDHHDSLFTVTPLQTRLYDARGQAINHDPDELLRTQDLPPVYEENSCLYLFSRETLVRRNHRLGDRPLMYPIDPAEAWDIDEELDFRVAEFLMRNRNS
jgi:CMP-N-acetylneuraminic acid synthetase